MKILFDCTYLRNKQTGVDVYFLSLIKHLLEIDTTNEYIILVDTRYNTEYLLQQVKSYSNYSIKSIYSPLPLQVLYSAFLLPFYLRFKKINVYHNPYFFGPLLGFICRSTKIVITVHDMYHHTIPGLMNKKLNIIFKLFSDNAIRQANDVIVISSQTKTDLLEHLKIPLNKVNLIYQALNDKFANEDVPSSDVSKFGIQKNSYILTVGKVLPSKGISDLIKAFQILITEKNIENMALISAGINSGPYAVEIEKLIKTINTEKKSIKLLGYVNDDDLKSLYYNASIVAVPSHYEGFGLPLLEGMKFGKPLIVRDASSLTEIVGDAGLLFTNINELASGLYTLLTDVETRDNLVNKGYERIKAFSWHTTAQNTLNVYYKAK